jgi:hypothetical protein
MGRGKRQSQGTTPYRYDPAQTLLPAELADYFAATERKHFSDESLGSRFLTLASLSELLEETRRQRGSLAGDDREALKALGADADAFLPECRYLLLEAHGTMGMVDSATLPEETLVHVVRAKPNTPCSWVVDVDELPETELATVVIGPNQEVDASTEEAVWTAHPGLPCQPARGDDLPEGAIVTVAELRARRGDCLLNARLSAN